MSDKYIKEITQNIPNNELNAAYDALMNSSLNETSDYEEVSMEELNEYIEGLECQAEDLRTQLAKANERVERLEKIAKGLCYTEGTVRGDKAYADWCDYQEQLRKEQD